MRILAFKTQHPLGPLALQGNLTKAVSFLLQAHLVAAFEQSLGNMTIRLQSLTMTAEQKVKHSSLLRINSNPQNQTLFCSGEWYRFLCI